MSVPRYALLASKALDAIDAAPHPAPDAAERARTIAVLARQLSVRNRRLRRVRWACAISAVAAITLGVLGGVHLARRGASVASTVAAPPAPAAQIVVHTAGTGSSLIGSGALAHLEPLDNGRPLVSGSRVVTPTDGSATLSFSTGTTVLLHEGTDVTVAAEGAAQVMRLEAGSVELHVAKLAQDERFVVDTSDSEVEVRGTRFRVSIVPSDRYCGAGTRTRVAVMEGVVVVRHQGIEDRVAAGDVWPSGCPRSGPGASFAATVRPQPHAASASGVAGSTLAEQNDLFTIAVSAKRRGDMRTALADLDRFLATYPKSPLLESAVVERMRVLYATSPTRARSTAYDYLAAYPNGFAHTEAEAILAEAQ